ncbi:ribose utilization transcriptional repressor RbsR [Secundilactobacillus paracollinoides]|uniref:LacI family transcriptional regulator n=2 Tax=Secundilactobacillus paracollinoides TaxID=240427 RepID=A0A1B2J2R5_9LACO|nr:LacI family DNA-binding transcriptional regulator [Secundilactobacillus paracollinoides]ANZ68598.1 LacI family transcriptional regulator [Secundilactobacillus paracollinoides]KRL82232.1 ribose operon repressor [Secundilactobacillus paracollinoides DSM 15502 = JCM 11969]
MTHKTTIKELAAAADVSVTTVSQILNGKSNRFSLETIDRVQKLSKKMNYVPNFNARNLILNEAKSIGVVVPNIGNPFFSSFIDGIQRVSREFDYLPFNFSGHNNPKLEEYYVEQLIARGTNGLIIASSSITKDTINGILKKNRTPYLLMDQNPLSDGDQVRTSDKVGGHLVAKYLLSMGHKKIVIIVPDDATDNIKLRITGFKEELTDQNINPDETVSIIFTPLTKLGGYDVAGAVIDSGASAVFAVNDEMAIGLYRGLKNLGIEVPRDISVMGYDGIDLGTYVEPALTTIQQPIARMGELAMQLLINRINNPDINHQVVELPVRLIQRESVVNISTI